MANFSTAQLDIAKQIHDACVSLGHGDATLAAICCAITESSLVNVAFGDISVDTGLMSTSLGLYQQTDGYGPAADRMNIHTATRMFLLGGPQGQAAYISTDPARSIPFRIQDVQRSQFDGVHIDPSTGQPYLYAANYIGNFTDAQAVVKQIGVAVTPRYPGAYWRPSGTNQGSMDEIRGLSLHEAVTRATVPATGTSGIWGWVSQSDACHLYDDDTGALEQYKEFGEIAYGVSSGNSSMLTYESWDNLDPAAGETDPSGRGSNQTSWTPEQCERKADVIAFLHHTAGLEIRVMASSNRSERGVAPHRWGVDPWRAQLDPNGETWTGHPGKSCPGDLRIAQIPGIVARAQVIADAVAAGKCAYLPVGPVDLTAALARTHSAPPVNPGGFLMALTDAQQAQLFDRVNAMYSQILHDGIAPGQTSVASEISSALVLAQQAKNSTDQIKAGQNSLVTIFRAFAGSISALGKGGAK